MPQTVTIARAEETLPKPPRLLFSNKDLYKLFWPILIEQGLEFLVGLAASIMVAYVGEAAVSGVSLVDYIMALLINLFGALATGGAVIAGQYMGRRQLGKAREAANQLYWFAAVVSIVIMLGVYLGRPLIIHGLFGHISPDVSRNANTYLTIVAASIPFLALYNAGAAIFRTMGNSKVSMKIAVLMNAINLSGNALLLYHFHLGTEGVAIPSLVCRMVAAAIITVMVTNPKLPLHIEKTFRHRFDWTMIKRVLSIGSPYGLENCLFQLGRILVLSLVSTFGTAAIAANAVSGTIAAFGILPGCAINLGQTAVISRCIGAGDYEQAKFYSKKILAIVFVANFGMNVLILSSLPMIMKLYGFSELTASLTIQIVWLHALWATFFWPIAFTLPTTFRAAGDARYPMGVSITTMIVCRIVLAYTLGKYMHMGVVGTWYAMFIDWIARSALFIYRYYSGKWMRYRAI